MKGAALVRSEHLLYNSRLELAKKFIHEKRDDQEFVRYS